ncbi:inverse autotransporter beta domain-containing protein [Roseimicrobium sp. ORNL1]|uniref:inverse autotransporter beta domain-containing protein n=1 Tax=Roseimicrobium sp. ORNL1 TaxID=2711231 RepID=UPI0013E0FBAA|nr:inverse autotransporter beta domain-containing protein [Roseimicrobium sp. ORNL1]QIF04615.1 hypothetical protein G5S37_24830 [Roseimicrobium sp. ORNL1]
MKFTHAVIMAACSLVLPALAGPVEKNPAITPQPIHEPWTLPLLGTGVKSNDVYTDGHIFLNVPLWSTIGTDGTLGGSYLFIEPYTSVGEGGESASSMGIGFRHLFNDQPISALTERGRAAFLEEGWYLGGSLFIDMLRTEHRNEFWQLGFGAEVDSRYLELRGNYYLPLESGRKGAGSQIDRQTFSSSSTRRNTHLSSAGDPFATGNLIAQDATYTTTATTTIRTTTLTRTTQFYERGMEGWDIEAGFLVPGLDEYMDVKIIGGYASMENQPFGPQERGTGPIRGWRAGLEVRPVPAVVLTGLWHENEAFTGSDWSAGIELQIPLDRTWKDAFKPRRRHLVERMAEPVHRQNAAIRLSHSAETKTKSETKVKRVTKVVAQSSQRIVLEDDIIFVNNGAPVGNGIQAGNDATGNGTAEAPMSTVQAGANIAQGNSNGSGRVWNVYTQGTAGGYTEDVTTNVGSVNFIGSGQAITAPSGKRFGSGPAPRVQGAFWAEDIPFFGMAGYHVDQSVGSGIRAINVSEVEIRSNRFTNTSNASVWVAANGTGESTALIANNRFSGAEFHAALVTSNDTASMEATVVNNIITGGENGIGALAFDDSTMRCTAIGNRITGVAEHGINLQMGDTRMDAFVHQNLVEGAGFNAMRIHGQGDGYSEIWADDNTFRAPVLHGIHVFLEDQYELFANFERNTFNQPGLNGVRVELTGGNEVHVNVYDSIFNGSGQHQINATNDGSGNLSMNIHDNTFRNAADTAIRVEFNNITILGMSIRRNSITGPGAHGIHVFGENGFNVHATIVDNRISNTGASGNGIYVAGTGNMPFEATVTGNVIAQVQDGVRLEVADTVEMEATVENNIIAGATGSGIHLEARELLLGPALLTANVLNNQVLQSPGDGISLINHDNNTLTTTIGGNTLSGITGRGIYAQGNNTSSTNVAVTGNTISNIRLQALHLQGLDTALMHMTFDGNTAAATGLDGLPQLTIEEAAGVTTFNGSVNNFIPPTPAATMTLDSIGNPSGTVRINGADVLLPVDLP